MDFNEDINQAVADEIKIDGVGDDTDNNSATTTDTSQENSEEKEGNVEATEQQADDNEQGENTESKANDVDADETGEQQTESSDDSEAEGETETEGETTEEEKPDTDAILKELSNGQIESAAGLTELLEENQRLQSEIDKPREPEFANDRAKKAYEFLQKHGGEFEELTQEAHRVLSIDPETMGDKELQFAAFALERKDLSKADARLVFNMKYDKLFGDLEDDPDDVILKDELKVATIEAKAKIANAQEQLKSELTPTPKEGETAEGTEEATGNQLTEEQIEEVRRDVKKSTTGFESIKISLGKEGKESVNVALNNGQVEALSQAMENPAELLDAAIAQHGTKEGGFNYDGYRDFMTKFIHHDRIVQETYNQGINVGKRMALDGAKNLDTKDPAVQKEKKEEPTFVDAWTSAVQGDN